MQISTITVPGSTARERGAWLGAHHGESIRETVRLYLELFVDRGLTEDRVREIAESCFDALTVWAPNLAEEITAVADAAGAPLWQLAAVNARTEVLSTLPPATEGECSTAVFVPNDGRAPQTIQTWDWLASLAPEGHLIEYTPDVSGDDRVEASGADNDHVNRASTVRRVRLFTEPGVLGKIGVNSAGVGVHFNILNHTSDRGTNGVPVHAIARRVLDEAVSVDDAERIIRSASASASTVLTVTQAAPGEHRAACFEISPERVSVLRPDNEGYLVHTNNFVVQDQLDGEATRDAATTYARLEHLGQQRGAMADRSIEQRAAGMCGAAGSQAPICMTPDPNVPLHEQWETLLTVGFDLERFALDYYPGLPSDLAKHGALRFH